MKRLLLYVHFDADGLLDPHVFFQVSKLVKENISVIFISNSSLKEDDQRSLAPLVDRIILRPNSGFDFGAWKDVILESGRDGLERWDELILMNSTCYGPLFPLSDVFHHMDEVQCDFWALTRHGDAEGFAEHLQSYFLVLKRSAFLSECFFNFWRNLPVTESVMETVMRGEISLSQTLLQAGLSAAVYADCDDERWDYEINYRPNQSFFAANYMLRHYKIPFVKVKAFYSYPFPSIDAPIGLLSFITSETAFPADLIVAHQRRIAPVAQQARLPDTVLKFQPGDVCPEPLGAVRIAVVLHIFYAESCQWLFSLLRNIPYEFDCYISVCSEVTEHQVASYLSANPQSNMKQCLVKLVKNRGRDILPWLQWGKELVSYDLVLKLHSKQSPTVCDMFSEAWRNWIAESLIASPASVGCIVGAFQKNMQLGIVLPPYPPVFHVHKQLLYKGTAELETILADLYRRLDVNPPSEIRAPLFPVGSMFWYRPAALQALHELTFSQEDFPNEPIGNRETMAHAIERSILYVAQAAGYSYRLAISEQNLADTFLLYEDVLIKRSEEGIIISHEDLLNENRRLQQHLSLILNSRAWKLVEFLRKIKHVLKRFTFEKR